MRCVHVALLAWILAVAPAVVAAGDWPQFMHDAQHTGDASDERLEMPLRLVAQVQLDDAVLTSPAVVGGRVYVVDQMGTAYCIDPDAGRILWRTAPEGDAAFGSNTSSPCVDRGRVFYGTTAGKLHILDAASGTVARSVALGWPMVSAITSANGAVYFQTLDAVVHCLDLDGNARWRWGARPSHYGGGPVTVAGNRVVVAVGYDLVCLEDRVAEARVVWKRRMGATHIPLGTAVSDGWVYSAWPGSDGAGKVMRLSLKDGSLDRKLDALSDQWAVLGTPAVRGATACFGRQAHGVTAHKFGIGRAKGHQWSSFGAEPQSLTPSTASPALSERRCLFATLSGELVAVDLASRGRGTEHFRFTTPYGKAITSSPAIANGRVYFGCDDGCLYVLGRGPGIKPTREGLTLHRRRSRVTPAGGRAYAWPSAFGGPRNACFVDDPGLKPPFRLRWAVRSGGIFKQPVCATREDVVYATLAGLVVCREQRTGRIRWRRKLARQGWTRASVLCANGRVYVPRMFTPRYPKVNGQSNALFCLDAETGEVVWERPIGIGDRLRASPVLVDGVVAFGSLYLEPRGGRRVIPPNATWRYLAGSDPKGDWTSREFDAPGWKRGVAGFGYGDGDDRTLLDMHGRYSRVYLRRTFPGEALAGARELTLMVRYDDAFIAYLNGREVARAGVGKGRGASAAGIALHEAEGFQRFPIRDWRGLVTPGANVIALEGHNVSATSSDFSLAPYLVARTAGGAVGQIVDAWDAETGEPRWQVAISGRGHTLSGPAGCAGDGMMLFTAGGTGRQSAGETVAIAPTTGRVMWRTDKAYASMTGTPSYQGGRVYLPGVHKRPMACLSAADGSIVWQHENKGGGQYHHFVHALSLGPDYFTINNKYKGGAIRWRLSDGSPAGTPGRRTQLAGRGHGCGSVVLTSEGLALFAASNGLSVSDSSTGEILWRSLGFAPRACSHPIVSNGRIFYAPQVNGMLYCFEPLPTAKER